MPATGPLRRRAHARALALALCLLVGSVAQARGGVAAEPRAPGGQQQEPKRFFGGRTVVVTLPLLPTARAEQALRAQLFQRSTALATPIGDVFDVEPTRGAGAWPPRIDVSLPGVSRTQDFELRVEVREASGDWRPAGRVPLRVYPADLLEPLRRFSGSHALHVDDDGGLLAAFLRDHDIAFHTPRRAPRPVKRPGITLYAGRAAERAARAAERPGRAVLFLEREQGLPHVVVEGSGAAARITVEMRLLSRLASDPLAQQTFVGIFELFAARQERGDLR